MKHFVLRSWLLLLYFEFVMLFRGFKEAHEIVRKECVRPQASGHSFSSSELCYAMDLACVFYFKQVFCLQRSAATVLLLRHYGWDAEMVIGTQVLPLRSHAWVEIKGSVVNDKPYMPDIYLVLTRY
jgi:hypothetical protein